MLIDKELVVIKIQIGVDLVFVEQVIANGRLVKQVCLAERDLLPVTREQRKQLSLEGCTRTSSIKILEERVLGCVLHHGRVESHGQPLGKPRLAGAQRAFDCDVAEIQPVVQYSSDSDANGDARCTP